MKAKLGHDRSSGSEFLEVRLTAGEHIDISRLGWLASRPHRYLLQVGADLEHGPHLLTYDVTGLESLHSFLHSYELTPMQYENMLVSVDEALGMLADARQPSELLRLDERLVYTDVDGNLWFLYLPTGVPGDRKGKDPLLTFLRHLARPGRVALSSSDDLLLAERLRGLLGGEDFSLQAYQAFLVREYGIRLDFSDTPAPEGQHVKRPPQHADRQDVIQTNVDLLNATPPRTVRRPRPGEEEGRTTTFRLVALDGSGGSYALGDGSSVVVGRGSACDVRIPNNLRISRRHARIEHEGAEFRVTDLGSSNGTFVRGRELHEGESGTVRLGETFELADVPMTIRTS